MDFIERLSATLGKQYLFKQDDGTYYNRYIGEYQTQEQAEDWLLGVFKDAEIETSYEENWYTIDEFYEKCIDGTIGMKQAYGYCANKDKGEEYYKEEVHIVCDENHIDYLKKGYKNKGYTHIVWYSRI